MKEDKLIELLTDEELLKLELQILETIPDLKIDPDFEVLTPEPTNDSIRDILSMVWFRNTIEAATRNLQCTYQRNRSLGDLYRITKHYYPNISLKEFRSFLFDLIYERRLAVSYCSTIKKRIYHCQIGGISREGAIAFKGYTGPCLVDIKTIDEYGYNLLKTSKQLEEERKEALRLIEIINSSHVSASYDSTIRSTSSVADR